MASWLYFAIPVVTLLEQTIVAETPDLSLTTEEKIRLHQLERVVEKHLDSFLAVGKALAEIRSSRLYRQHFPTLEAYVREHWALARGITHQTFQDWRRRDPAFAWEVEQAAARGTVSRLKEIEAQGKDGAWQALSWLVERRHPAEFAKPEVALNIGIQNNLTAQGTNGSSFETLVVSDLEFLGLRQREGYEHRPRQREACEVEAEIVPENLSGTLVVATHPGGAVISESQAAENERRIEKSRKEIEALIAAKVGKRAETEESESAKPDQDPPERVGAGNDHDANRINNRKLVGTILPRQRQPPG
jgi:hypothetical protein